MSLFTDIRGRLSRNKNEIPLGDPENGIEQPEEENHSSQEMKLGDLLASQEKPKIFELAKSLHKLEVDRFHLEKASRQLLFDLEKFPSIMEDSREIDPNLNEQLFYQHTFLRLITILRDETQFFARSYIEYYSGLVGEDKKLSDSLVDAAEHILSLLNEMFDRYQDIASNNAADGVNEGTDGADEHESHSQQVVIDYAGNEGVALQLVDILEFARRALNRHKRIVAQEYNHSAPEKDRAVVLADLLLDQFAIDIRDQNLGESNREIVSLVNNIDALVAKLTSAVPSEKLQQTVEHLSLKYSIMQAINEALARHSGEANEHATGTSMDFGLNEDTLQDNQELPVNEISYAVGRSSLSDESRVKIYTLLVQYRKLVQQEGISQEEFSRLQEDLFSFIRSIDELYFQISQLPGHDKSEVAWPARVAQMLEFSERWRGGIKERAKQARDVFFVDVVDAITQEEAELRAAAQEKARQANSESAAEQAADADQNFYPDYPEEYGPEAEEVVA